jgi:soluble lytic murein transglycosylase-like protein
LKITELAEPKYNIDIGCQVLREYLDKHNQDYVRALLAYVGHTSRLDYVQDIFSYMKAATESAKSDDIVQVCGRL